MTEFDKLYLMNSKLIMSITSLKKKKQTIQQLL